MTDENTSESGPIDELDVNAPPIVPEFELFGTPEQIDKLYTELAFAQGEFEAVAKDTKGQDGNRTFQYADLASMVKASRPSLAKHRISITQYPLGDQTMGVLLTVVAGHGARIHSTLRFRRADSTVAGVPGIKLFGGTLTYLSRYVLRSVLGLPGDDDLDSTPNHPTQTRGNPPPKPQNRPQERPQIKPTNGAPQEAKREPEPKPAEEPAKAQDSAPEPEPPVEVTDDVNGPDGEPVPDGEPSEWSTPGPIQKATGDLLTNVMANMLGKVPPAFKAQLLQHITGKQTGFTEGDAQRVLSFAYDVGQSLAVDPEKPQPAPMIAAVRKAFEKRMGIQ